MKGKVSYESAGLLIGPSPAFSPHTGEDNYCMMDQFNRIQSADFSFSFTRQDLKQLDSFNFAGRKVVSQPEVGLNFEYLLTNSFNERHCGFHISHKEDYSAIKNFYDKTVEDRNLFFILSNRSGVHQEFATHIYAEEYRSNQFVDSIGAATQDYECPEDIKLYDFKNYDILGFGNSYLTNYTASAAVGSYPLAQVEWTSCNLKFDRQNESENITRGIPSVQTFTGCLANMVRVGSSSPSNNFGLNQTVKVYDAANQDSSEEYIFDKEDNALILIQPECQEKRMFCNSMSEPISFDFDVSLPTSLNRDTIECTNEEEHLKINIDISIGVFDDAGNFYQDADITLAEMELYLVKENSAGKVKKMIHEYGEGYGAKRFRVVNERLYWDDEDRGFLHLGAFMNSDPKAKWSLEIVSFASGKVNEFNVSAVKPIYHDIPAINRKTGDEKNRPKYNIIANDFIYPEHINALLPGDVVLNLQDPNVGGSKLLNDDNSVNIQSFDLNVPLAREDLYRLGSRYICDRKLKFPLVGSISFVLIVDKLLQGETHNMFANDKKYDFNLNLKKKFVKPNVRPGHSQYFKEEVYNPPQSTMSKDSWSGECPDPVKTKRGEFIGAIGDDPKVPEDVCEDTVTHKTTVYKDPKYFGNENEESQRLDFIIYKIRGAKLVSQNYSMTIENMLEVTFDFTFEVTPTDGFFIEGAGEPIAQEHNFLIFQEDQPFMITMEDSDTPISLR